MNLFDYSYEDIVRCLKIVGLKNGDKIFVHSNIGFFGKLKDADNGLKFYENFKKAIFEIIGYNGTLVVPTFTYSFMNNDIFDREKSSTVCGMFSEMVRNDSSSIRSNDPNFSVSAIGMDSNFFTENLSNHSFDSNSFWNRFLEKNGKICNFNFDSGSTFFHFVEKTLNVEYRFDKQFSGNFLSNQKIQNAVWTHFVFDHNKKNHWPNFEKFSKKANNLGLVKIKNLGKGQITCISARDTFDLIKNELKNDPSFLIDGPL